VESLTLDSVSVAIATLLHEVGGRVMEGKERKKSTLKNILSRCPAVADFGYAGGVVCVGMPPFVERKGNHRYVCSRTSHNPCGSPRTCSRAALCSCNCRPTLLEHAVVRAGMRPSTIVAAGWDAPSAEDLARLNTALLELVPLLNTIRATSAQVRGGGGCWHEGRPAPHGGNTWRHQHTPLCLVGGAHSSPPQLRHMYVLLLKLWHLFILWRVWVNPQGYLLVTDKAALTALDGVTGLLPVAAPAATASVGGVIAAASSAPMQPEPAAPAPTGAGAGAGSSR
jgi:hypothetical protein